MPPLVRIAEALNNIRDVLEQIRDLLKATQTGTEATETQLVNRVIDEIKRRTAETGRPPIPTAPDGWIDDRK